MNVCVLESFNLVMFSTRGSCVSELSVFGVKRTERLGAALCATTMLCGPEANLYGVWSDQSERSKPMVGPSVECSALSHGSRMCRRLVVSKANLLRSLIGFRQVVHMCE